MADKTIVQLNEIDAIQPEDSFIIYDNDEVSDEKVKQVLYSTMYKYITVGMGSQSIALNVPPYPLYTLALNDIETNVGDWVLNGDGSITVPKGVHFVNCVGSVYWEVGASGDRQMCISKNDIILFGEYNSAIGANFYNLSGAFAVSENDIIKFGVRTNPASSTLWARFSIYKVG